MRRIKKWTVKTSKTTISSLHIGIVFAVIWIIFSVAIMGMLAAAGIDITSYM